MPVKTLPDGDPTRNITVGYDTAHGMKGIEEVYGDARVGNDQVTYKTVNSKKPWVC